jgi:hypothetical protein
MLRAPVYSILALALATPVSAGNGAIGPLHSSWPQSDLERSLVAAAEDNSHSSEFFDALLKARVCALSDKPLPTTFDEASAKEKIALMAVKAPDGALASPVFTSPERATETFGAQAIYVCGKAEIILNALRGGRVVLDPGQPYGFILSADDIEHLLGSRRVIGSSDYTLQLPADAPGKMITGLKSILEADPAVSQASLSLAWWPSSKEWSWFLSVQTTADAEIARKRIRDSVRNLDMLGRPLDLVFNTRIDKPDLWIQLLKRDAIDAH